MPKSVHILSTIEYRVIKGEEGVIIRLNFLSPAIKQKLKFGIEGKEQQYSFDELAEVLSKSYVKRGDILELFVVKQKNGDKQNFEINVSVNWPEGLAGDKVKMVPGKKYEITQYLKNIGILD